MLWRRKKRTKWIDGVSNKKILILNRKTEHFKYNLDEKEKLDRAYFNKKALMRELDGTRGEKVKKRKG